MTGEKKKSAYHALLPRDEVTNLSLNILATNKKKEPSHLITELYLRELQLREV